MALPLLDGSLPARLSEEELWSLVGTQESNTVDFKEQLPKPGKLQDPCVAFANHRGGTIVVGVSKSRPHVVVGTSWGQDHEERVQEAVRSTHPPLDVEVSTALVGRRRVALLQVASADRSWVQTSDGRVLVRSGPTNRALIGPELQRFLRSRDSDPVEDEIVRGSSLADLDRRIVRDYLARRLPGGTGTIEGRMRDLGWTDRNGRLRLSTSLVFGKHPQRNRRRFGIEILRFAGSYSGGAVLRQRTELVGPLPRLVEQADRAIYEEMRHDAVVRGLIREEVPEFPPVVVREALLNAVAHRDYAARGSAIQVRIFDDVLEIESPGALPGYVTIETLRDAQYSRNERIVDALQRLGLVEEAGQGIDRMFTEMEDALLDPPDFEERDTSFVVRLRGTTLFTAEDRLWVAQFKDLGLSPTAKMALVYVRRNGSIKNEELRALRDLDRETSRNVLMDLVTRGVLTRTGERRGTRYVLGPTALVSRDAGTRDQLLRAVLHHARRQGSIANADVRGLLDVDRAAATKLLGRLVALGQLEPVGERRGRHYIPRADRARE